MIKSPTLIRIAVLVMVASLLIMMSAGEEATWATSEQDVERQTVPTRTPTPDPVTPTVPPPTDTPEPSPTNAPPPPTPTVTVTETASATMYTLPQAGGESWIVWGGALLLLSGALLLLAGSRARWRTG